MEIYNVDTFPYNRILKDSKTVRKHKIEYINIPCAFDIETTSVYCESRAECPAIKLYAKCTQDKCKHYIKPYSFMYIWMVCIKEYVCIGRTWEEYKNFIEKLQINLELTDRRRLVFYVHNLSYEFQFLKSHFRFDEIFAREERKPIKAHSFGIEYRCSYYLTNMSLEKALKNTPGCKYAKKTGQLDYSKKRYPWTHMTEEEMEYCIYDVFGLSDMIRVKLKDDTLATIPLTNTGYVRRDFRAAYQSNPKNKQMQLRNRLNKELYLKCKEEFRGGNTHANYLYVDQVIENVESYDITSSYPHVMMTRKFPQKFIKGTVSSLNEYMENGYACIFSVRLIAILFTASHNIPYIAISKLLNRPSNAIVDNGRILKADEVILTVNEIDFALILKQYKIQKIQVSNLYIAKKNYLPEECRRELLKYFYSKTTLKDVKGKEYEYAKSKNQFNSSYGMMVTDIVNDEIYLEDGEWKKCINLDIQKSLNRYYSNRNNFLSYQDGLWVTAYARENHYRGIDIAGRDMIYGDTDSIKIVKGHKKEIEKLNESIMEEAYKAPIVPSVDFNGKEVMMGIWDYEGTYKKFKTLGAKKYCYIDDKDELHLTVAGLGKDAGKNVLNGEIERFKIGTIFYPSGRLNVTYNDDNEHYIVLDGRYILSGSNVALYPGSYKLGVTEEYEKLFTNGLTN